ncbi:TPA: hypothetical protein N0F65_002805 [Lagenidium giganteum]|uniref:Dienelactone hydrolase domain-containing protein n=1 Tax=Lagenidium giganteum TaxID=4803 RepID=A0AAV2Z9G4_9STRA|nr:TPA: hypothetical protein N0F65_002805 [Lagenidium giganteum]
MSCCPATAEPAREAAPSVGTIKKFGQTTAGIIALPDIFGLDSGRSKADADHLGKLGYAVVLVDLVDGDYLQPDDLSGLQAWFRKYPFDTFLSVRVNDAVKYLKQEVKVERLASYGYCWGSWVGATLTTQADPVVAGHVSFHPTWIVENILKGDNAVVKLAESVKVPQLLLAAGDDPDFVRPNGSVHKVFQSRADIGANSNVLEFPDQKHGWVHRGDLNDEATKKAVMKAWHDAFAFIGKVCPK